MPLGIEKERTWGPLWSVLDESLRRTGRGKIIKKNLEMPL